MRFSAPQSFDTIIQMHSRYSIVVANEAKLNADGLVSFTSIESLLGCDVSFHDNLSGDELVHVVSSMSPDIPCILISKEMRITQSNIEQLPANVSLIIEAKSRYDNIDVSAADKKGIMVCNCLSPSREALAQLTLTFILSLSSSLTQQQRRIEQEDRLGWQDMGSLPHFELNGKTLGLIGGRGSIGSRVSQLARCFGMQILISTSSGKQEIDENGSQLVDLPTLLSNSDFVSIHCPGTEANRHLIGAKELKLMKPSAFLINTSRGYIVDEEELIQALTEGRIAGAGLDVMEQEPLPVDSRLFSMPQVILTNHIGWKKIETRQRLVDNVASVVKGFIEGSPVCVVSKKS